MVCNAEISVSFEAMLLAFVAMSDVLVAMLLALVAMSVVFVAMFAALVAISVVFVAILVAFVAISVDRLFISKPTFSPIFPSMSVAGIVF